MGVITNNVIEQEFLFKNANSGISKKTGKPYRMLQLHDQSTLENVDFFLDEESTISTEGLKLKDKVKASFAMQLKYGNFTPVIVQLQKL